MRNKKTVLSRVTASLLVAVMTLGCVFGTTSVYATDNNDNKDIVITNNMGTKNVGTNSDDDDIVIDNETGNTDNVDDEDIVINNSSNNDVQVSLNSDGVLYDTGISIDTPSGYAMVGNSSEVATYAANNGLSKTGIGSIKGFNYLLDYSNILVSKATIESSDSKWKTNTDGSKLFNLYYDASLSGTGTIPSSVSLRWSNVAEDGAGLKYDMIATFSNIQYNMNGATVTDMEILCDQVTTNSEGKTQIVAWLTASQRVPATHRLGVKMDITYKLVSHGTNNTASGNMLLAWSDLDQPGINVTYSGGQSNFLESVHFVSGTNSAAYVESDTYLSINSSNTTFLSTRDTTGYAEESRSGVSVLGNAAGTTITWAGSGCGTKFITDLGSRFTKYTQTVKIRHQLKSGSWGDYTQVDSRKIAEGMSYWYQWTRGNDEPSNVYSDPSTSRVGTDNVSGNKTYYIDVPRKQYTYSFDFNPPSGHSDSEIGNKQSSITKYAENVPGDVKSPTLTGYTFLGWSTNKSTNDYNANESMLSNKTYYARWRANTYYVRYNANGTSNPNQREGEFTQNTVTGTMANSQYTYDIRGVLRKNAFAREGYEFVGWNTKADGTGTAYPNSSYDVNGNCYSDEYSNVYNWTAEDGKVLDLYAQWKKKLGTETVTVVSEETGKPVANVNLKLYKNVNGRKTQVTEVGEPITNSNGQITVNNLHWFDYTWEVTKVPTGYSVYPYDANTNKVTSQPSQTTFRINYNQLSAQNEIILWMKRVGFTLDSQVSDIIRGENAPSFMYTISGTDVAGVKHTYHMMVDVSGTTKEGSNSMDNIYAGTYTVTQTPVSRYVPQTAKNISNSSISGINATLNLTGNTHAEAKFPYVINQYGGFGSMSHRTNELNSVWK